jgi:hypothetical protein
MWKTVLEILEDFGLILLASVVVTALYVAVVYLRSWIDSCENDADKKHWRE